ncbi:MAG: hypothetical protein WCE62_12375, partial [Polyangiales bacterium]
MRKLLISLVFVTACGDAAGDDWKPASGAPDLMSVIDVWAFSQTDVWFIDGSATVQRYDGAGWTTLESGSSGGLLCIFALSSTEVWLCAGDDVLFYDGATFTEMDVSTPTGLDGITDIWASSRSDVWVMTDSSEVSHFDGTSWQTMDTFDFVGDLAAVWGPAPDDLWAVGSAGAIAHYDGNSWTEVAHQRIGAPYLRMFLAVHGTSSTDV